MIIEKTQSDTIEIWSKNRQEVSDTMEKIAKEVSRDGFVVTQVQPRFDILQHRGKPPVKGFRAFVVFRTEREEALVRHQIKFG